ncbi:unnamed protein product [Prunus armeniaca]
MSGGVGLGYQFLNLSSLARTQKDLQKNLVDSSLKSIMAFSNSRSRSRVEEEAVKERLAGAYYAVWELVGSR